jgi:hypothetical protein
MFREIGVPFDEKKSEMVKETKNGSTEDEYLTPGKGKGIVCTKVLGQ